MLNYPITLHRDTNNSILVGFPDVPEANSVGDDEEQARVNAADALLTALEIYFDERRPVPLPSAPRKGQTTVRLPALPTAKVLLWNEMLAQKMRKADLARRLGVHMPQIDRLFDLNHPSRIDFVEKAAHALGKRIEVRLG
jgi:antitoxin HicB